jgi:hypothetical protein
MTGAKTVLGNISGSLSITPPTTAFEHGIYRFGMLILRLQFLPMLPIQILLNNLLYDVSEITIPFDNVDQEYLNKPRQWGYALYPKLYVGGWTGQFHLRFFDILCDVKCVTCQPSAISYRLVC